MSIAFFPRFVGSCAAFALILGLLPLTSAVAQTSGSGASSGALILRGELIAAPYLVEVVGDSILVNGRSLGRPSEVSQSSTSYSVKQSGSESEDQLFQRFWIAWDAWCAHDGVESAQEKALWFWRSTPGVARAYFPNPQRRFALAVQFLGEPQPTSIELRPPTSSMVRVGQTRAEILQQLASSLRAELSRGELVIVQDEGYDYSMPPGRALALLHSITTISNTVADSNARYESIRTLIPDDEMARDIAIHFQP